MARNSQKIIQLLRSSRIYTPIFEYVNVNDDTDVKTQAEYDALEPSEKENYEKVQRKSALENAMDSFNPAFVAAADPQDGEIMLARYQETGEDVKAILASYTKKAGYAPSFTFYLDSVAINEIVNNLVERVEEVETKNTLDAADKSVVVDVENAGTTVAVNVDWANESILKLGNDGIYTDINLVKVIKSGESSEGVIVDGTLDENVREAYRLMSGNAQIGQQVNIYKDSALKEIYLGSEYDTVVSGTGVATKYAWQSKNDPANRITDEAYQALDASSKENYKPLDLQSLNYIYQLANGTYSLVSVDVSKFLAESEFGAGLKVENGVVSLDVRGEVTVGEDVTYVAININEPSDKLTAEEYAELEENEKESYYRYVAVEDPMNMVSEYAYSIMTPQEKENYQPISINDTVGKQTNVFNTENGIVDVNAIQDAIDYASLSAAEGVRVGGSDSIIVDNQNTVYVRLSNASDNILTINNGAAKGLYLSSTWDCGEY